MEINTIEELLNKIENQKIVEHKYTNIELRKNWNDRGGEKISALANNIENEISWMIIGMNDDGSFTNEDESWARDTERIISQQINTNLDPVQASKSILCAAIKNIWIIIIKVANPGAVVKWNHTAYKKSGTTIAEMSPREIMEFTIRLPGLEDYSKQEWNGEVDETKTKDFILHLKNKRTDLLCDLSNPSQCFDYIKINKSNTLRILLGNCRYRIIFYDNKDEPVKNETKQGLFDILRESFIDEINNWARSVSGSKEDAFPRQALREGLANSIAHAAYFESDGDIIIEVYTTKVVISNLCLPDCEYFANRWFSRSHKTINGLLMETMRLAGFVDELGRGKNLIFKDSICNGKKMPQVNMEKAGRYDRWRLTIYGGPKDKNYIKLLCRIRDIYVNEQKALIAYALVLWHNLPVGSIKNFVDDESARLTTEILSDLYGPIFYYESEDRIILQRWVRILLEEGKDSKSFDEFEEESLFKHAYDIQTKYYGYIITPKRLRELAHMSETKSDIVLSSSLLKKWDSAKKVEKFGRGKYKFIVQKPKAIEPEMIWKKLFNDYFLKITSDEIIKNGKTD